KNTIHRLVCKVHETGAFADKKRNRKRTVLTEEKLDDIAACFEQLPHKSLSTYQQVGVSTSSVWNATKLLKFKPYTIGRVHKHFETDYGQRLQFCNWYLQSMNDGCLDPQTLFCTDEAWFHLSGFMNSQNQRHWASKNPHHNIVETRRHETKIAVWCAISGSRIVGPLFHAPDLNPCDFYLWGNLKGKVYANNPHTLDELKENIRQKIALISVDELQRVFRNFQKKCEACIRHGGRQFQHNL
ncbi:hypothetical protein C0J52_07875, partial [Blattella germanica]